VKPLFPGDQIAPTGLVVDETAVHISIVNSHKICPGGLRPRLGWLILLLFLFLANVVHADPAMWVIRDHNSTTYLVGTLHLLKHQTDWKSDKLTKAVAESKELWLEIADPENQAGIIPLLQKYGYDREKPLSTRLNAEQKHKLEEVEQKYNVPDATIEPLRPWLAGVILAVIPLQKAGFDANAGVDHLVREQAVREGDQINGFETQEQQVRFLAELPEPDQIAFLADTLDDVSQGIELLDKLAAAWIQGDTKTINDYFVQELKTKAPSIYQKLIVDRNRCWADQIAEMQRAPGVRLIAVGAGHLVGPDSVQAQLAKKGIKAEPY
jgi:uncharacterized protein